jgi:tyrosyl-tRNA synthetase
MNIEEQVSTLMQGTEYGDENLKSAMAGELRDRLILAHGDSRPLRVYCGYDPRTTDLHLGHTITMRKLRQFQELGHEVTFLVGTFTSLIGDPSDKNKLRPQLTPEEVEENARTYAEQSFKVLDKEKTIVRFNAEWLSKLTFTDLIRIASNFTVQQFLTRDNFRDRLVKNDPIFLHETFYALMQAFDALELKTDVQVGGTDQLFNIISAGRKLMVAHGEQPNIGIIMGILPGTDGEVRMSKSLGNHIALNTNADDMYGKIMSLPDEAMSIYSRLVTRWTPPQVTLFEEDLKIGKLHPRDAKMKLAYEITSIFYDQQSAEQAQDSFINIFREGNLPDEITEFEMHPEQTVLDVLFAGKMVNSRSEGRRMILQNGVRLDGETLTDPNEIFPHPGILNVGKRRFLRVVFRS